MTVYKNFIGVDIGKSTFVVSLYGQKSTLEYENSSAGIAQFMQDHKETLLQALCVVETTGGCELDCVYTLMAQGFKVHRADTRKVKNFIRSFGASAKTDALDAKALANYGFERHAKLDIFKPLSKDSVELFQLVQRRRDLKAMGVAEKNRLQSPSGALIKDTITQVINVINQQGQIITDKIQALIEANPCLKQKKEILKTIPGIGEIIAFEVLILLPELGTLSRRKIASLAGVAPRANESGKFFGYRRTGHGR